MNITIDATGLNVMITKLASMSAEHVIRPAIKAGGEQLMGAFKEYPNRNSPSRASVYGQSFKSDKQRRFVMAMIRKGLIPYRRSGDFLKRWALEQTDDLNVIIGNTSAYGGWLMRPGVQSLYMARVGWRTTDMIAKIEEANTRAAIELAMQQALTKLGVL